jgi:cytoskeleton protein RodZ
MSTISSDTVAAAPRVGADLRAARERLGWQLEAVAAGLRIRGVFLAALEAGRIGDLPGNAYAIGFLRTYATTLGLDPDEVTRRFRAEAAEVNKLTALSFPAPVPSRGVPAGAVVLLGVVLAIGAYVGWYHLSGNGELPPEVVPPVPARLASLVDRTVPPAAIPPGVVKSGTSGPGGSISAASGSAGSSQPGSGLPGSGLPDSGWPDLGLRGSASRRSGPAATSSTSAASGLAANSSAPNDLTPSGSASPAATGSPTNTATLPEPAPMSSVSPTQAAAATTMPPAAAATQPRIVLSATADAWMQVRDKSGQVLLNRVLHPGESWPVPAQPNLVLTTGNAGGTAILVDGTALPSLGASGAVRHDIPLDADMLKVGKAPSAALPTITASSALPVAPAVALRPVTQ